MAMASRFSPVCLPSPSSLFRSDRHGSTSMPPPLASTPHDFAGAHSLIYRHKQRFVRTIREASVVAAPTTEETKEYTLPTWSEFELGMAPVFWKTMNGLPPTSGENLTLFYNPVASNLIPNSEYGVAFNGGFNQPIMCGGEPRVMTKRKRGKADPPIFTIKIRVPSMGWPIHAKVSDYEDVAEQTTKLFNEGLAQELSAEGACERAIFPDPNNFVASCAIGNIYTEGGNSCKLNLVQGCMDPDSPLYNPLADVDDGSCPLDSDTEEE